MRSTTPWTPTGRKQGTSASCERAVSTDHPHRGEFPPSAPPLTQADLALIAEAIGGLAEILQQLQLPSAAPRPAISALRHVQAKCVALAREATRA